jgi:hypothetical protein
MKVAYDGLEVKEVANSGLDETMSVSACVGFLLSIQHSSIVCFAFFKIAINAKNHIRREYIIRH